MSDESIPDGTFGGTYKHAPYEPVTPEQAAANREVLERELRAVRAWNDAIKEAQRQRESSNGTEDH